MNKFNSQIFSDPLKLIAMIVFVLFCFLSLLELGAFVHKKMMITTSVSPAGGRQKENTLNLQSPIFQQPLFGNYLPTSTTVDIKESMLDFEVVGIMYSSNSKTSQVILRVSGGEERLFSLGDQLPGGAVIQRIDPDNIIVLHNGALESLKLPKGQLNFDAPMQPLFKE